MDRVKLSVEQMKSLRGIADGKPAFLFDGERQVGQLLYLLDTAIKASLPEAVGSDEIERAFQMLALYGVPRERARGHVALGIQVLATRLDREEYFQKAQEAHANAYLWLTKLWPNEITMLVHKRHTHGATSSEVHGAVKAAMDADALRSPRGRSDG